MATQINFLFTSKQTKDYAIINDVEFKKQHDVRMLALSAAALMVWSDHARSTFSASTAARYLESLWWDPSNPNRITMGVVQNTLASLLEYGQDPMDLRSIFLRDKSPRRVIPFKNKENTEYAGKASPFTLSVDNIRMLVSKQTAAVARYNIKTAMSSFDRGNATATSYMPAGMFISTTKPEFRTITPRGPMTPAKSWRHPGIRAALIQHQVASWVSLNRESFTNDMFQGEPGILL